MAEDAGIVVAATGVSDSVDVGVAVVGRAIDSAKAGPVAEGSVGGEKVMALKEEVGLLGRKST